VVRDHIISGLQISVGGNDLDGEHSAIGIVVRRRMEPDTSTGQRFEGAVGGQGVQMDEQPAVGPKPLHHE
jgi:hypothetical protein